MSTLIRNAFIVNEGEIFRGSVWVVDERIEKISREDIPVPEGARVIEAEGCYLLPGVIDDQVHFRDPGLTHKGSLYTESRAAVAGGVTSFMEMPNTKPQTLTQPLLEEKFRMAARDSVANFSFYMGVSNDNLEEVLKTDPHKVCGVKIFLGASTGNMLVDDPVVLEKIFASCKMLIAIHSEDEGVIQENVARYRREFGEEVPIAYHPVIRSEEACYRSTKRAVALAKKHNTRLHVLHLSTAKELELLDETTSLKEKRITGEVCVHHLWFDDRDYASHGTRIKWNPAIKTEADREALFAALCRGRLDVVATDHAPHTLEEKSNTYFKAPSGGPLVQHSLVAMCELAKRHGLPLTFVADKMAHAVADLFRIVDRGYLREGYYADMVLLKKEAPWQVTPENIRYKCGWSPFEGCTFSHQVVATFVNGNLVFHKGEIDDLSRGKPLSFNPEL
ncbi:MAG: dihydroorotase [Bacteroidetes bacterium]|nr:MAG: dihydroorotase [Bacteroidota bacterium]